MNWAGCTPFISWPRPILTDSGGFQVFSISSLRDIAEGGVSFRSHLDGSSHFLSPEKAIEIQMGLGADLVDGVRMNVQPHPSDFLITRQGMERTLRWALKSKEAFETYAGGFWTYRQWLFGIGQGGIYPELRRECIDRLLDIDFPGYAMGGLSSESPRTSCTTL